MLSDAASRIGWKASNFALPAVDAAKSATWTLSAAPR